MNWRWFLHLFRHEWGHWSSPEQDTGYFFGVPCLYARQLRRCACCGLIESRIV
jgi:hypothetical protein